MTQDFDLASMPLSTENKSQSMMGVVGKKCPKSPLFRTIQNMTQESKPKQENQIQKALTKYASGVNFPDDDEQKAVCYQCFVLYHVIYLKY